MNINLRRDNIVFNFMMLLVVGALVFTGRGVFLLLIPIIDAIYTYRNGLRFGIIFSLISPLVLLFLDPVVWMLSATAFAFLGVTLGYYIRVKQPHEYAIFAGLIVTIIGLIVTVVGIERVFMIGDISDSVAEIVKNMEIPTDMLDTLNANSDIEFSAAKFRKMAVSLMPSVTLMSLFFYVVFIYLIVCAILKYWLGQKVDFLSLRKIKLPGNPIIGAAIVVYGGILLSTIFDNYAEALANNSLYIGVFILAIQGAATAAMIIHRTKLPRFLKIVLTLGSIVLLQIFGLAILGFFDVIFDVRRLRLEEKPRE